MAANDRGTIGRPDVLARFQVWGGVWPLHWNASLTEGREIVAVRDVIAEVVAHGPSPVGISGRVISLWAQTPCSPNRSPSPFRVHAPGLPSLSVCIRLPGPAGLTHL